MKQDRISVFVRVRPYQQKQPPSTFISSLQNQAISVRDIQREKEQDINFTFDHIFPIKASQKEVFQTIGQPIVNSAFQGINSTIFAYGQTSSGKTYTCIGPDCEDLEDRGLLPRSVSAIFSRIAESPNFIEFRIKVSMVEIYMQKIRDLLQPSKTDLRLRENKSKGVYIQDVTEEYVGSAEQAMKVFKRGVGNRVVAFTNMNDLSSRSHMAFILTLHQNNLRDGSAKSAKLTVVDLAGSEKVSKTLAEGRVLDQAKQINKSLSSLGNVINALTDPKTNHIPYRDSKLTRLLQESIGGNSKTSLIINISPSAYNAGESISSLRFGYRAKQIKNKPKVNKQYTIAELLVLLDKAQKRNQELQLLLKEMTASASKKVKNKANPYIENLLDSDNPLMSALSDNEQPQKQLTVNRSALKTIKKCYESEIGSEGEEENLPSSLGKTNGQSLAKLVQNSQQIARLKQLLQQRQQELHILSEQLIRVNGQRVQNGRQLDICKQRLQLVLRQARLNVMKFNAQKRESELLLQKYIKQNLENQEKEASISKLQSKINDFEQKFMRLSQLKQQQDKKSKVFGIESAYSEQANKIIQDALNEDQNQEGKRLIQETIQLQKLNKELRLRVRDLQQEIKLYANLQKAKQDLIKQKLGFIAQRDRVYKDLQNRIEKVLQLQQKLDEQREHNKNLMEIVDMDDTQKGKKIISLQNRIHEISEDYYVLKGQQSSWLKNNKKIEDKVADQQKKIIGLQGDNMELRAQIQSLRMRCEQLQAMNENQSQLDVQLQQQEQRGSGNIVKVIRSHINGQA